MYISFGIQLLDTRASHNSHRHNYYYMILVSLFIVVLLTILSQISNSRNAPGTNYSAARFYVCRTRLYYVNLGERRSDIETRDELLRTWFAFAEFRKYRENENVSGTDDSHNRVVSQLFPVLDTRNYCSFLRDSNTFPTR